MQLILYLSYCVILNVVKNLNTFTGAIQILRDAQDDIHTSIEKLFCLDRSELFSICLADVDRSIVPS